MQGEGCAIFAAEGSGCELGLLDFELDCSYLNWQRDDVEPY